MSTWPTSKLGQLAEISRGSSPRPIADTKYFENGQIPWIKIADATKSGKFLYETKEHVNDYGASFSRRLPPGTILVAASGTLGYTQILGVEGCAHDGWLILQNLRNLDRDFAYYTLKTLTQHFYNAGSGAAIQNINTEILRQTEIPHPPIAVQCRIGKILGAYDDLIEVNRRRVKLLEEMARGLFEEWFVRFRFPGHETVTIVDTPNGPMPEGWTYDDLRNVAEINALTLKPVNSPAEIGYIDIASVSPGQINAISRMSFAEAPGRARRIVRDGSILWSNVRPNRRSYAIVMHPPDGLIASTGFTVLDARKTSFAYLYHWVTTDDFVGYLSGNASGAAYPAVTAATFERASVLLPSADLVKQFTRVAEPIMRQTDSLRKSNICLTASRDLLLPRLISGQLSVEAAEQQLAAAD